MVKKNTRRTLLPKLRKIETMHYKHKSNKFCPEDPLLIEYLANFQDEDGFTSDPVEILG